MARPGGLVKVVLSGFLPNGEIFQTGVWVDPAAEMLDTELQAFADWVAAQWTANNAGWLALIGPDVTYDEVRVYNYPTGGTAPASSIAAVDITAVGTASNSYAHPLQICLVATLRTAIVGRRYRGRMYVPMTAGQLGQHQANQIEVDGLADDVAGFLSAINDYPGQVMRVVVMSAVGGAATTVTRVEVNSDPDVQRRRSNRDPALRSSSEPVTP